MPLAVTRTNTETNTNRVVRSFNIVTGYEHVLELRYAKYENPINKRRYIHYCCDSQ